MSSLLWYSGHTDVALWPVCCGNVTTVTVTTATVTTATVTNVTTVVYIPCTARRTDDRRKAVRVVGLSVTMTSHTAFPQLVFDATQNVLQTLYLRHFTVEGA